MKKFLVFLCAALLLVGCKHPAANATTGPLASLGAAQNGHEDSVA